MASPEIKSKYLKNSEFQNKYYDSIGFFLSLLSKIFIKEYKSHGIIIITHNRDSKVVQGLFEQMLKFDKPEA